MKRLTINLDMSWVLSHRGADKLPATTIAELLEAKGIKVLSQSFTEITADIQEDSTDLDTIQAAVVELLGVQFSITAQEAKDLIHFQLDTIDESASEKATVIREIAQQEPAKSTPANKTTDTTPSSAAGSDKAAEIMAQIHGLLGAGEFITLCDKLHKVAPLLKNDKLPHILMGRSYLFSIDDGYGLSSVLGLMAQLFEALQVGQIKGEPTEQKLAAENGRSDPLGEMAQQLSGARNKLICIDISLWMDKTATPEFRDFLSTLQKNGDKVIYVFRVPYLEKEALNRIETAISDVMSLDTASFVPLTRDELLTVASSTLSSYGLQATDGAWEMFQQRLAEERSDGRFYGIKTAKKVVDEMVYRKFLAIATEQSTDDRTIAEADLLGFVSADTTIPAAERLEKMVGIDAIRSRLEEIVSQIEFARKNSSVRSPAMHMRFVGNPGTGKTTVARIVGQMLKERGILSKGYFFEHTGGDFLGMYVGHTAPKTLALCRDAYGSVLFIDEAYTLADASYSTGDGYAKEAIDTLIAQMENHREDMVVIMAGYPKEMDRLMALNPGLAGRIPYELHFPNYTQEELYQIFLKMVEGDHFQLAAGVEEIVHQYFLSLPPALLADGDFSNARFVRNLFERTWSKTVMRAQLDGTDPKAITAADFETATRDDVKSIGKKQVKHAHPGYRLGLV